MINNVATYSDNVIAEAATQLFDVIRRAFLKSRFGLGTYLSTRIRHGVFEESCVQAWHVSTWYIVPRAPHIFLAMYGKGNLISMRKATIFSISQS